MAKQTPQEIAHGAVDRLCAYDAWDAPGDYDDTVCRIGAFLEEFTKIAATRLAGVVRQGDEIGG